MQTHFKGWAKPGPIPPGAWSPPDVPAGETLDAISGHFRIFQLRDGHRFSTDDVLTAWYGTSWAPSASSVLDLGSGIGSVGMIAAWRLPGARVVTIEAQDESVRLARKSAAYNGLESRYEIRHGDFRASTLLRVGRALRPRARQPALLSNRHRDRGRSSPEGCVPVRAAGRHRATTPGRPRDISPRAECSPACFPRSRSRGWRRPPAMLRSRSSRRRPVVFKEGEEPLIGLFAMMRGLDLPESMRARTWVEPPLVIRARDGRVHPEYSAVKLAIGFPP